MGLFNKNISINQEIIDRCSALVYYTLDRLTLVVEYHRVFCIGAVQNLGLLVNPSCYPGTEKFKFRLKMMEESTKQIKNFKQSKVLNFDHLSNMKVMDDVLKRVASNIKGLLEIYEDNLCVDFDSNLFKSEHYEILHKLLSECIGITETLNAEIDKLETEYYALHGAFDTIISQQNWQVFDGIFVTLMKMRFKHDGD